ncbi:hypothetical protein GCM10027174_38290 [Salinifilum aidingensis]
MNESGLFTRAEALAAGYTDHDLRDPKYRRVIHGVYALREVPPSHALTCRAASMVLPPGAVFISRSAATLHGVELAHAGENVEVLGGRRYRHQGVYPRDLQTAPDEHEPWYAMRLATPVRAAFDLLARFPLERAVAYTDALVHNRVVRVDEIARFIAERRYYGVRYAERAFPCLDGRAESIPESVLRLVLVREGFAPVPQHPVFVGGEFLARLDLAFPKRKVAVEYDGMWHSDVVQARHDRERRARLAVYGWTVIVVNGHRLATDRKGIIAEVRHALGA